VSGYLQALEGLMVIEDQPAPKRHFVDPSLALAAVGAAPERLLQDLDWFGQVFESLVIRDLPAYSQGLDGEVLHAMAAGARSRSSWARGRWSRPPPPCSVSPPRSTPVAPAHPRFWR
jgi:hypothetical protein